MTKRRTWKSVLESASIAVLEQALARRRSEVEEVQARRARLAAQLADVEQEILALRGEASAATPAAPEVVPVVHQVRRTRRPAGSGPTLRKAIAVVLKGASGPLRLAEIADGVKAAGYATRAKTFTHPVHKALARHSQAAKAGRGVYVYQA